MPAIYIGMKVKNGIIAGNVFEVIIPDISEDSVESTCFDEIDNTALSIIEKYFKDDTKAAIHLTSIESLIKNNNYKDYYWKSLSINKDCVAGI